VKILPFFWQIETKAGIALIKSPNFRLQSKNKVTHINEKLKHVKRALMDFFGLIIVSKFAV
jgi:hypothetical protein